MKALCVKINKNILLTLVLTFFLTSFVFAAHVITTSSGGTSYSVDEDIENIYNITVSNTDLIENITQVNITIPSTFIFTIDSNATSAASHTFSNSSTVLSWVNDSLVSLVENGTSKYFWFNATALTPGEYNLTVTTTNVSGSYSSNISVSVNDTTAPYFVDFISPTSINSANSSQSYISANVSVNDSSSSIDTIRIYLYNSTGLVNNTNVSAIGGLNATGFVNFSSAVLPDGIYYLNATANDTAGNENLTGATRQITLDVLAPTIAFSCDSTSLLTNIVLTCSCSATDAVSGVASTVYVTNPSTSIEGSYTTTCTVTDYAGNAGSSTFAYEVSSGAGGGGSTGLPTYSPSNEELILGYQKFMSKNARVLFEVDDVTHTFKVDDISKTDVLVSISSDVQTATFFVGDEKKFNIDNDNYYDMSIKLNSIDDIFPLRANFTIKLISEIIKESSEKEVITSPEVEPRTEDLPSKGILGRMVDNFSSKTVFGKILVIILIILLAFFIFFGIKKIRYSNRIKKK